MDSSLSRSRGGGRLNAFYWYQIFDQILLLMKHTHFKLAWRLPNFCNVSSQRNNLVKLTHYDETQKMAHESQIAMIAKENLKLSHSGPSQRQASGTNGLKL